MSKNKFHISHNETHVMVSYHVGQREIDKEYAKEEAVALKSVKVKGYRPGKAPLEVAKGYLNPASIMNKVMTKIYNADFQEAFEAAREYAKENELDMTPRSEVDLKDNGKDKGVELTFKFAMLPKFDLDVNNYDLKLKLEVPTLEDAKQQINEERASQMPLEEVDAKSDWNDRLVFDFKGFIDNEAFEGGEATDFELVLGSGQFIPGFEESLIGKKPGWKGSIKVKFPENYHVESYRGKPAEFEIEVKKVLRKPKYDFFTEIESQLKDIPASDKKNLIDNLVLGQYSSLWLNNLYQAMGNGIDDLIKQIKAKHQVKIARSLLEEDFKKLSKEFDDQIKEFGIKRKEYLNAIKSTEEAVNDELYQRAEEQFLAGLIYSQLNAKYSANPTEEEKQEVAKLFELLKMEDNGFGDYFITFHRLLASKKDDKDLKKYDDYLAKLHVEYKQAIDQMASLLEKSRAASEVKVEKVEEENSAETQSEEKTEEKPKSQKSTKSKSKK